MKFTSIPALLASNEKTADPKDRRDFISQRILL